MKRRCASSIVWAVVACGHPSAPSSHTAPPSTPAGSGSHAIDAAAPAAKVGVALTVTPADADVVIADVDYGKASQLPAVVELKPGLYTLVVSHEGFAPYRVEFSVGDKVETFVIRLEPLKHLR